MSLKTICSIITRNVPCRAAVGFRAGDQRLGTAHAGGDAGAPRVRQRGSLAAVRPQRPADLFHSPICRSSPGTRSRCAPKGATMMRASGGAGPRHVGVVGRRVGGRLHSGGVRRYHGERANGPMSGSPVSNLAGVYPYGVCRTYASPRSTQTSTGRWPGTQEKAGPTTPMVRIRPVESGTPRANRRTG